MPSWRAAVANTSAAMPMTSARSRLTPNLLHPLLDGGADDDRAAPSRARRARSSRAVASTKIFASASALPPVIAARSVMPAGPRDRVHQRRGVAAHHAGLGVGDRAVEAERLEQAHRADRQRVAAPHRALAQVDLEAAAAEVEDRARRWPSAERLRDGLADKPRFFLALDHLELDAGLVIEAVEQHVAVASRCGPRWSRPRDRCSRRGGRSAGGSARTPRPPASIVWRIELAAR